MTHPPKMGQQLLSSSGWQRSMRGDFAALSVLALLVAALHMLTNGRYGFHRDELQVLDDSRHLALGYVAYPPLTPLIERVALALFGSSLIGLRSFSVLAQAAVLVLSGFRPDIFLCGPPRKPWPEFWSHFQRFG